MRWYLTPGVYGSSFRTGVYGKYAVRCDIRMKQLFKQVLNRIAGIFLVQNQLLKIFIYWII